MFALSKGANTLEGAGHGGGTVLAGFDGLDKLEVAVEAVSQY